MQFICVTRCTCCGFHSKRNAIAESWRLAAGDNAREWQLYAALLLVLYAESVWVLQRVVLLACLYQSPLAANNIIRRLSFFTEVLIHKECDGGARTIYVSACRFLSVSALKFIQLVFYTPERPDWLSQLHCPWLPFSEWLARMCLEIYQPAVISVERNTMRAVANVKRCWRA